MVGVEVQISSPSLLDIGQPEELITEIVPPLFHQRVSRTYAVEQWRTAAAIGALSVIAIARDGLPDEERPDGELPAGGRIARCVRGDLLGPGQIVDDGVRL